MGNAIIERVGGVGVDCDDATATTAQVLTGYTFGGSASEELQTGAMPNMGATNYTITTNGGSVNIGNGYHSGSGKVTYTLASASGGTTYTPTASAQTISLSGKYLKNNISVAGSSNLISKNILSGKTIWGVAGSHQNIANVSTVYNGSAFYGFLASGVINAPTAGGSSYETYDNHWCGKSANSAITSGSLYVLVNGNTLGTSRYSRFVSAKSVNFNLFSTLRITGYFKVSVYVLNNRTATASVQFNARERSNDSGATAVVAEASAVTPSFSYTGTDYDGSSGGGTISFDLSFDISDWTDTASFLDVGVRTYERVSSTYVSYSSMGVYITGIYLT